MAHISPELLGILRCPVTGSALELHEDDLVATAPDATTRYSLLEGIPVMLRPADAAPATPQESPTA